MLRRLRVCAGVACLWPVLCGVGPAQAAELESRLSHLLDRVARHQLPDASPLTLILETDALPPGLARLIEAQGGQLRFHSGRRHQLEIPAGALARLLALLPASVTARLPFPHEPLAVTSQGVAIQGADDFHALGIDGSGVKIGIIDLGFGSLAASQASGDLPVSLAITDYTGTGNGGTSHGTQVAEIVHDMAPGAQLYLAKVSTDLELQQAVDDLLAAGVQVINHSVAWYGAAFYDGTGPLCGITDTAEQGGVLWVNAAGNSRNKHWLGSFSDADGDLRHEFAPGQNWNSLTLNAGQSVTLVLNWDAYPVTSIDYNLYLYDGNPDGGGSLVASSTNRQRGTGSSLPYEAIDYTAPAAATYYVVVTRRNSATASVPLTLFSLGPNLDTRTQASSLVQPADCASAVAVGAVNLADGAEGFSSEGPTTDGRAKPEIAASNRTLTSLSSAFTGTSGASPHVAGGAGLLLAQNPGWSVASLRAALTGTAQDVATTGFDYRTGYGRLSLDADGDGSNHDTDNCPLVANASQADLDGDGLGDACDSDRDGDGLANADEAAYGADPDVADTDGDGLNDGSEVYQYATSPASADTDGDGLSDGDEVLVYGTSPLQSNLADVAPRGAPDGVVNTADALVVLRLGEGLIAPTPFEAIVADVNQDGLVDVRDALALMRNLGY